MNETRPYCREERIAFSRNDLREAGPGNVLSYLLKTNEAEKIEVLDEECGFLGSGGHGLYVALHLAAGIDARELLASHSGPFEDCILQCETIIFVAAIGEPVLRNYLRHLLLNLIGECAELDEMIELLVEMYKRRHEIPTRWSQKGLDEWWEGPW